MPDMTDEEHIAELREACEATGRELISKLAHAINNPNHALMLNVALLRNVWNDLEPLLDSVPWASGAGSSVLSSKKS